MPYLPGGVEDLPESRVVLFADQEGEVRAVDESLLVRAGESFTGRWTSPSLNRQDISRVYTLRRLMLFYQAQEDTTLLVRTSGNGGETFQLEDDRILQISATAERVRRALVAIDVSGFDLRFRLVFDTDVLVNVIGYVAYVQVGSDHAVGV